jgi:GT2 family glycosyltransferase
VILTCQSAYVTPHGTSVRPRDIYRNDGRFDEWLFDRRQMFGGGSFIQTSSLLMTKAVFYECRAFPSHGQHEDWEFVLKAIARGVELITVPEILVHHYAEEERPSLTASGRLDGSLRWIERMRPTISKRAFSGFCLTVVAHQAKRQGGWRDFATLLTLAFRYGRPTLVQLFVFFTVWGIPPQLHRGLRRLRPRPASPVRA